MNVGDVADEFDARTSRGDVACDEVGHGCGRLGIGFGFGFGFGRDAERPWLAGHEADLPHDLPYQLGRALGLFRGEVGMSARRSR
jgi:hypothetical protein